MIKWPNLFIVGAPKAGTTSLYEYLKKIPSVYMSPVKEPYYFCRKTVPDFHYITPIRDEKKYLELFKNTKNETIIGEASVWYLSDPDSPKLIFEKSPDAKIIIMLRDPVERAYSHYLMFNSRNLFKSQSFHEQLHKEIKKGVDLRVPNIRLRAGMYSDDVHRFYEVFGTNQIKLVIFEEFFNDTKKGVADILDFLGIDYNLSDFEAGVFNPAVTAKYNIVNSILNISIINKIRQRFIPESFQWYVKNHLFSPKTTKPKMLQDDRNLLKKYYAEDVRELENFLGRTLPWDNFK